MGYVRAFHPAWCAPFASDYPPGALRRFCAGRADSVSTAQHALGAWNLVAAENDDTPKAADLVVGAKSEQG